MKWNIKQEQLQTHKNLLTQIDTSQESAELFLKTQSTVVVNLVRDLDYDIGMLAKQEVDKLWELYYKSKEEWTPKEHYGGTSALDKKAQWIQNSNMYLQDLHMDMVDVIQDLCDSGQLLI